MTASQQLRFAVDHMLVKLGKYLRILGYDTSWDTALRTHELIRRANAEQRVFLTRNLRLPHQYPPVNSVLQIRHTDPRRQLDEVVSAFGLDAQTRLFSMCIRCNRRLFPVANKQEIARAVHPNVLQRHEQFFTCPGCGTVFWKGAHVRNTCRKLGIDPPLVQNG